MQAAPVQQAGSANICLCLLFIPRPRHESPLAARQDPHGPLNISSLRFRCLQPVQIPQDLLLAARNQLPSTALWAKPIIRDQILLIQEVRCRLCPRRQQQPNAFDEDIAILDANFPLAPRTGDRLTSETRRMLPIVRVDAPADPGVARADGLTRPEITEHVWQRKGATEKRCARNVGDGVFVGRNSGRRAGGVRCDPGDRNIRSGEVEQV